MPERNGRATAAQQRRLLNSARRSALMVVMALSANCSTDSLHNHDAIQRLKSPNAAERMHAADVLGRNLDLEPDAPDAVDALILALDDSDALVQNAATVALVGSGLRSRTAIPALVKTLGDTLHPRAREQAAEVLGSLAARAGGVAIAALTAALGDSVAAVRMAAAEALGKVGAPASASLPRLARLTADSSSGVRLEAAKAATKIDPSSQQSRSMLFSLMHDANSEVRLAAARGIAGDTTSDTAAVATLAGLLRDPEAKVRTEAAAALGALGRRALSAAPALSNAMTDRDSTVRNQVKLALQSIENPSEGGPASTREPTRRRP